MQRRHVLCDPVVLEHVEEGRLSGVVQAQEDQFAAFLRQSCKQMLPIPFNRFAQSADLFSKWFYKKG